MLTEPTARSRTPTARATIHRKRIPKRPTRLNIGSQPIEPGLGDLMCHKGDMRTRWKRMLRQRQVANYQITTARMTTSPTQPTTTRNVPGRGRFAFGDLVQLPRSGWAFRVYRHRDHTFRCVRSSNTGRTHEYAAADDRGTSGVAKVASTAS